MDRLTRKTTAAVAAAATLLCLALPAGAGAARNAEVSIMDDVLLLGRSQRHIDRQMRTFQRLGVDRVRVSAFWKNHVPDTRRKPRWFRASDPNSPGYSWAVLDRVVGSAYHHGLKVMITITTPAPRWATRARKRFGLWRPRAREFGLFSGAVARRYAPWVDHYGIQNEPNQGGWLQPQSNRRGLVAPHQYRAMVRSAYPRIKLADPGSVALIGNLASSGSNRGRGRRVPIKPLAFLRAMGCVNRRWRPMRRGSCRGFKPVPADALGHHPYQFFRSPRSRSRSRDDAAIGDGRRLLRALDRLVRRGRIAPGKGRRLAVFYTEFGYQTDPPDPFAGVSLRRQSRWLQEAAYVAWRTPRIRGLNQFRLVDGPIRGRGFAAFREFQTGLLFHRKRRRKKPAYRTFPHPFVIAGSRFWGQVRPGGAHPVALQHKRSRRGTYRTVAFATTSPQGYFVIRTGRRRGYWRYLYGGAPSGNSQTLRIR